MIFSNTVSHICVILARDGRLKKRRSICVSWETNYNLHVMFTLVLVVVDLHRELNLLAKLLTDVVPELGFDRPDILAHVDLLYFVSGAP